MKHIKCVVVGDEIAEKTKLLNTYVIGDNDEFVPTVFDNYTKEILVDDQPVNLQLWDTSGQQDYKKLRPLSYPQTDVFIVAFALISPTSLESTESMWVPEIKEHCPDTPYILVGTYMNARDNFDKHKEEYESNGWEAVPKSKGEEMKEKILANDYMECDIGSLPSIEKVFLKAIKIGLNGNAPKEKRKLLTIGLYGENKDSKTKIALDYILGDFHKGKFPIDLDTFFKVEYIGGSYYNVTVDIDNKQSMSDLSALVFIYDVGVDSLEDLKTSFAKIQKSNKNGKPYVLVLNYVSEKQEDEISDETVDELIRDFKCNVFEIRNYSKEDIECVFFYLNQRMAEQFSNTKKPSHKQLKRKIKSKSKQKIKS